MLARSCEQDDPERAWPRLVSEANLAGGIDNISALVARIGEDPDSETSVEWISPRVQTRLHDVVAEPAGPARAPGSSGPAGSRENTRSTRVCDAGSAPAGAGRSEPASPSEVSRDHLTAPPDQEQPQLQHARDWRDSPGTHTGLESPFHGQPILHPSYQFATPRHPLGDSLRQLVTQQLDSALWQAPVHQRREQSPEDRRRRLHPACAPPAGSAAPRPSDRPGPRVSRVLLPEPLRRGGGRRPSPSAPRGANTRCGTSGTWRTSAIRAREMPFSVTATSREIRLGLPRQSERVEQSLHVHGAVGHAAEQAVPTQVVDLVQVE